MLGTELLVGPRVRLSALTRADAAVVASWYEDAEFLRLFDTDPALPKTAEEIERMFDESRRDSHAVMFGIRAVSDGELIGIIGLDGISWNHHTASLGIGLGRAFWDQGLGGEAMRLMLRFAFMELNLHRVGLTVFEYNQRALALYKKLGFVHEGTVREHLLRDGRRYDMYQMGLLASEWRAREQMDAPAQPFGGAA